MTLLLSPLRAAADKSVEWRAPAECPNATEGNAAISAHLQRDPLAATVEVSAVIVITRVSPTQLEARVAVRSGDRLREHILRDASCSALTQAAALIVSLAVDPAAAPGRGAHKPAARSRDAVRPAAPAPESPASPTPDVAPTPSTPPPIADAGTTPEAATPREVPDARPPADPDPKLANEPERLSARESIPTREPALPPRQRVELRPSGPEPERAPENHAQSDPFALIVGIAAGLSDGILPQLAATGVLSAGVTRGGLRGGLRIGYAPRQRAELDQRPGAGGAVALAHVALEAGLQLRALQLEFPLLVGVEAGLFVGRGEGVTEHATRIVDWLAPYLSAGISHTWDGRWRVGLRGEGLLGLRRPRFALDLGTLEPAVFHRPRLLSARIFLTVELVLR